MKFTNSISQELFDTMPSLYQAGVTQMIEGFDYEVNLCRMAEQIAEELNLDEHKLYEAYSTVCSDYDWYRYTKWPENFFSEVA